MNDTFTQAGDPGNATRFEDHYMRMAMRFDAGARKYAWLNQHLFVAEGRLTEKTGSNIGSTALPDCSGFVGS